MASTVQKRAWYKAYECEPAKMVGHTFPGVDRTWQLLVADVTKPAWEIFTDLMTTHGYLFREVAGGTYRCRNIANTNLKSLHSYGIAVDLNPSKNPFGTTKTDMPKAFTDAVLATGLFRWGMDFKDPMHWEIDVSPDDLKEVDDMPLTDEDIAKVADATVANLMAEGIWQTSEGGQPINFEKIVSRDYRNITELVTGYRAKTFTQMTVEQLEEIAEAVGEELSKRLDG